MLEYNTYLNHDYTEISVTRNLQRVPVYEDRVVIRYEMQKLPLKSKAGIRKIPIPEVLTKLLRKAHMECKLKVRMVPYFEDNDLIYHNELGEYLDSKKPLRRLILIIKKLDLSLINIHGLRHTFATRLFEAGDEI